MKNAWTDQQLREAVQASLAARHYSRPAADDEEGNPGKAIPYTFSAIPQNDHSFEQSRQSNEHGFTAMSSDNFEA